MQTISKASTWAKLLYEIIGTAILVFSYNAVQGSSSRGVPLAYLMMFILAFKISGAHFNPATSVAVLIQ